MNSMFGQAKAWFTPLPTISPASNTEPATSSPNSSISGQDHGVYSIPCNIISTETANSHLQKTANFASPTSLKNTKPDNESSSDDDCFITAIQKRRRENPVQAIPKTERSDNEEPFRGRFAVSAKDSMGTKDKSHADKSNTAAFPSSLTNHDKPPPSYTENSSGNASTRPNAHRSNPQEVRGNQPRDVEDLSKAQSASSAESIGFHLPGHNTETSSIFGASSSKRPIDVDDIEVSSRSGSVDNAKRRKHGEDRHQLGSHDRIWSKDQLQRSGKKTGSSRSRYRTPFKPLNLKSLNFLTRPGDTLDNEKSKEVAKAIKNTPATAAAKATETIQQISEQAKETTPSKPTEDEVLQHFAEAPIATNFGNRTANNSTGTIAGSNSQHNKATGSIFGVNTATNPTTTIVPSNSWLNEASRSKSAGKAPSVSTNTIIPPTTQPAKDTNCTHGDQNPAVTQPATDRNVQVTQPPVTKRKPSQPHYQETDEDLFKRVSSKQPPKKTARLVNSVPISGERTGYKFTAPSATNGSRQPPREDRESRLQPASRRKKSANAPSTKNRPAPTTRPPTPQHLSHLSAASPAPEPASIAVNIPPPPAKNPIPVQSSGLSSTDPVLQYVVRHTGKHPLSESATTRHYRATVHLSKAEANEACRQRLERMTPKINEDNPFPEVARRCGHKTLFQGTITYPDGDIQLCYVEEEEVMLADLVEKRKGELLLDEKGLEIYTKPVWLVWAVRYYPREDDEEEEREEEQRVLGTGEQRVVEVVDEGNEGDDEDDGEEEEDLFGDQDVDGQLNEGVRDLEMAEGQEGNKETGVSASGVETAGEEDTLRTSETLAESGVQTTTDGSQTDGRQTQTQPDLGLQKQQEQDITSNSQSQNNHTPPDNQRQTTTQRHRSLEGSCSEASVPVPGPHTPPDSQKQSQPQPQPRPPNNTKQRPPTPPLPCDLYSPPPPSTIYSSSTESDSSHLSPLTRIKRRTLPNNYPPPPPPLPSSSLLHPITTDHGTFTTLRLANLEALEIFKLLTKPEVPARMSDVLHWKVEVVPEVEARFKQWSFYGKGNGKEIDEGLGGMGMDGEEGDDEKEYGNGIDENCLELEWEPDAERYKWRFRRIEVRVKELVLRGPKDLGGLEVKVPKGARAGSGLGSKMATATGTAVASSSLGAAAGNGNGNVRRTGTGTGTGKATATATATATRTTTTGEQSWQHHKNARPIVKAKAKERKAKKRRRPTAAEKGKGRAVDVDPVDRGATATEAQGGGGKGAAEADQGIVDVWAGEFGGGRNEEGEVSEEE